MPSEQSVPARAVPARTAPPLRFKNDVELPISARREEILAALDRHQVLIVAGDTGSGKSTQLPQYCLQQGRGCVGLIAHTQPRRLAARALAGRIAEELSQPVGLMVGYRVRFADQVSSATRLVLMTDGLLLAELGADPELRRYDTIIVDEAHERSLNVDLLLGVLKRVLPIRPDLKLIVTSATLEVERVARFLDDAPVISLSGRGHPIEVRYAATPEGAQDAEDPDLPSSVLAAYRDIAASPGSLGRGDVLVFLPGEREIRDVAELLERELQPDVEVLSLYSRLSWEQQRKIFERGSRQRIVLATNVAETSITVPGIRAVIDSGLARISRYSPRNRLQRLPIEPVSRASAEQRKGRCGRIGPGLCLRLYSEADFESRPGFTEPEVLRTNLAALLLRLAADGLGEAESFPFIDPPDSRALNDGYRLLQELEALDAERRITRRGRAMARLPLDPRLARALLESKRFHAQSELLAIVAGLSVPDARIAQSENAAEESGASGMAGAFEDGKSEFSALYKLWRAYRKGREGPRRELKAWCRERRLSLPRLSEWEDVYGQVADRAAEIGIVCQRRAASYAAVHRALLAGFCTTVGVRGEEGAYLGTRGVQFHLLPGSPLKRRKPRWVMAANIVQTSRVFARRVAEIEPMWIEAAARHLTKREFLESDWDEEREQVVARERISFLGLTLSANRIVNYGPIAPEESRLIFAREALAYGRLHRRPEWLLKNDAAILAGQRLEERLRVRNLVQPPEAFVEHYAAALPRQVSSGATLEHFSRHLSDAQRRALTLRPDAIFARLPDAHALAQFPETAKLNGLVVPVEYRFAPGEPQDGATLRVALLALPILTRSAVDAAIPGLIEPRVETLLRSLPKEARRSLIPMADSAASFLSFVGTPAADPALLADWLKTVRGIPAALVRFDPALVPAHLMPLLTVIEEGAQHASSTERASRKPLASGVRLTRGTELAALRRRFAPAVRTELDRRARERYGAPWRKFEAAQLDDALALEVAQGTLTVFPTLARGREGLEVRFEWSAAEAQEAWRTGAVRLARTMLHHHARDLAKLITADTRLLLAGAPYFTGQELVDMLLPLVFRQACFKDADPPRTCAAFESALDRGRAELHPSLEHFAAVATGWFAEARAIRGLLGDPRARPHAAQAQETQAHLTRLLRAAAIESLSPDWLRQVPRYLKAEERRWQRVFARGEEAPHILRELTHWTARHQALEGEVGAEGRRLPEVLELGLWIEEYRVSLYAQELKTLGPISAARLEERATDIEAWMAR